MNQRLLVLALLLGALAGGLACSSGDDGPPVTLESVTERGEYGVGVTTTHIYDGQGQLVKKIVGTVTTVYIADI